MKRILLSLFFVVFALNSYTQVDFNVSVTKGITCSGSCDGEITIDNITGGASPYTYSVENFNGSVIYNGTSTVITGLCAGGYVVRVIDANGIETANNIDVVEPPILNSTITLTQEPNGVTGGVIEVDVTGGTSPYTYNNSFNNHTTPGIFYCNCIISRS